MSASGMQENVFKTRSEWSRELLKAVKLGDAQRAEKVWEFGADVNICDKLAEFNRMTPLHHATRLGWVEVVRFLLGCPMVKVDLKDSFGNTPFHYAVQRGDCESLRLLLAKKPYASVDAPENNKKNDFVHLLAQKQNGELLNVLAENIKSTGLSGVLVVAKLLMHGLDPRVLLGSVKTFGPGERGTITEMAQAVQVYCQRHENGSLKGLENKDLEKLAKQMSHNFLSLPHIAIAFNHDGALLNFIEKKFVTMKDLRLDGVQLSLLAHAIRVKNRGAVQIILEKLVGKLQCPICLGDYKTSDKLADRLALWPCGHLTHCGCGGEWIIKQQPLPTCPICRSDISGKALFTFSLPLFEKFIGEKKRPREQGVADFSLEKNAKRKCSEENQPKVLGQIEKLQLLNSCKTLEEACLRGCVKDVELLCKGCDPRSWVSVKSKNTVLHLAAKNRVHGPEIIRFFLTATKVDLEAKNTDGWTPLQVAVNFGSLENVQALCAFNPNLNVLVSNVKTLLHLAASNYYCGHDIIRFLVDVKKFNLETPANGWTPLQLACRYGSLKNVQALLELGAKIDIVMQGAGNNLLHLAVCNFYGGLEIVNFLVDVKKFNIEAQANGWTPLQLACRSGSLKNVQMLLELGAKIDIVMQGTGNNLLHLAVCNFYGGLEIVNFLVDVKKFNIEAQANGWTPLQLACRSGSLKNVQMLLELGANPGVVVPGTGNNLLHLASFNCHNGHDIIRFLVDVEKFNLEIPANGWTPLQLACRYGSLKSVQRFLRLGARIDVRLPNGMTLLDLAKYRAAQGTVEEKKESGVIVRYLS